MDTHRTAHGEEDRSARRRGGSLKGAAWAVGLLAVVAVAYLSTASPHIGAGDAPESAAGAMTWSVVHAPGYPLYVLLAGGFARVAPGGFDDGLNLFSAVTTLGTAALLLSTARRLGASRPAAAVATLGWALTASVWFSAGYAKHDALTALWWMLILGVVLSTPADGPSIRRCGGVGLLSGLSLGLGWAPIAAASPAVLWWARRRGASGRTLAMLGLGAIGGALIVALLVAAMTRAAPDTSWGGARDPAAILRLWSMQDFGFGSRLQGSSGPAGQTRADQSTLGDTANYLAVVARDMGPALAAMGVAGTVLWWRRRRPVGIVLTIAIVGNLAAVSFGLGATVWGFRSGIVHGGFLAPALSCLALASARAVDEAAKALSRRVPLAMAWLGIGLLLVGTSVVTHRAPATQLRSPVVRSYAEHVLDEVPRESIVVTGSASGAFPLQAEQAAGRRADVVVIMLDGLETSWYRRQLDARQDVLDGSMADLDPDEAVTSLLSHDGPVFLDHGAQVALARRTAYQPIGLVARVLPGTPGYRSPVAPGSVVDEVSEMARASGFATDPARNRWPNDELVQAFTHPMLLVAQDAINQERWDLARRALDAALELDPDRPVLVDALDQLPDP